MTATYNPYLVIVSALVALLASYTALDVAGRVAAAPAIDRKMWLVGGAISMGIGIWSMHFLAMLAFSLPVSVNYNFLLTVISLIAAILASGLAISLVTRPKVSVSTLLTSATFMGIGIGVMHYVGMAAMEMSATIRYKPMLFVASIMVAVVVSIVALKLFLIFRRQTQGMNKALQMVSAIVMACGILALHYTGMAAAQFEANYSISPDGIASSSLTFWVTIFTFVILGGTLLISADAAAKAEARNYIR